MSTACMLYLKDLNHCAVNLRRNEEKYLMTFLNEQLSSCRDENLSIKLIDKSEINENKVQQHLIKIEVYRTN